MKKYRFAFTVGSLLIIFLFTIIPLFYSLFLSLYSGRSSELNFNGLENFSRLLNDEIVRHAFFNTIFFTIILTPLILFLSIILAYCINSIKSRRVRSIYSIILYFPSITSPVAYAFFFKRMLSIDGFINNLFLKNNEINFLLDKCGARTAIILVCVWAWSGYYTIIILSSLQNINSEIYRLAKIDGLSHIQILFKVVIPNIKPIILFASVILSGGIFQLFAEVMIITNGGPDHATITLAYYIYQLCFEYIPQYGYASSISIIILILSGFLGFIQLITIEKN